MRISPKGQITIPVEIRKALALTPDCEVDFEVQGRGVLICRKDRLSRGEAIVQHMRGKGTINITTDELMAMTRGEDDGTILI
jgi:AbrB family looped-hinge helix DNA binding protein